MKRILLRSIAAVAITLVMGCAGLLFWARHEMKERGKIDEWNRDATPDAAMLKRLEADEMPLSITRVVEVGNSSRWTGDGEKLAIYCFPLEGLALVKGRASWENGFPDVEGWREHISKNAPLDLRIPDSAAEGDFIHIPMSLENMGLNRYWSLMDVRRGIFYRIVIDT